MMGHDLEREPSLDAFLDVLSSKYRRRLLVALLEHNPQEDDDAQVPNDVAIDDDDLEALQIRMIHTHLPKLEDARFIEWDRDTNQVRRGSRFDDIRPLLELMSNHIDELPDDWI